MTVGEGTMTKTARGKAFDDFLPTFTDDEAEQAYNAAKIVTSFAVRPRLGQYDSISYIAVKLALYDGSHVTMLLDRFSAELLHHNIQTVKDLNWSGDSLKPSDTRQ